MVRVLVSLDQPGAHETLRTAYERKDGMTALHMAALGGYVEVINVLSDAKHPVCVRAHSNYGETLWNTSALLAHKHGTDGTPATDHHHDRDDDRHHDRRHNHHDLEHANTGQLLQEISTHEISGVTPLHIACDHGHVLAAEELLSRGVEVDAVDSRGVTGATIRHLIRMDRTERTERMERM